MRRAALTPLAVSVTCLILVGACGRAPANRGEPPPWDPAFVLGPYRYDADFVDASHGWMLVSACTHPSTPTPDPRATGTRMTSPVGECVRAVVSTIDGGKTWANPVAVGPTYTVIGRDVPYSLQFLNGSDGFVFGDSIALVTHDGGFHWVDSGLKTGGYFSIAGKGSTAWAVNLACDITGNDACSRPVPFDVRKSVDGKRTWSSPRRLQPATGVGWPKTVAFGNEGLLVYGDSALELTTDGGRTWRFGSVSCPTQLTAAQPTTTLDGREIWVACTQYVPATDLKSGPSVNFSAVLVSEDGGESWTVRSVPPFFADKSPRGGFFAASIVATGKSSALVAVAGGYMYLTPDAGVTWRRVGPTSTELGAGGFDWVRYDASFGGWGFSFCTMSRAGCLWMTRDQGETWSLMPAPALGQAPPSLPPTAMSA